MGERCDCLANAVNIRLTALHLKWVMCIAHASKLKCLLIYLTTVPVCSISSKHVWRKFMSLLNIFMFQFTMQYFLFQNNVSIQVAHFLNGASVFVNNELLILFDQLFFLIYIYNHKDKERKRQSFFEEYLDYYVSFVCCCEDSRPSTFI